MLPNHSGLPGYSVCLRESFKMIHPERIHYFNNAPYQGGCVIYWMQRDQRVEDNDALVHAQDLAIRYQQPLLIVFCLVNQFIGATARQYGFMLKGLQMVESELLESNIPFVLLPGNPESVLPSFLKDVNAGCLVTDFNPLKLSMDWKKNINGLITIPFIEVDTHNILPARIISGKFEYGAFTLRKKIEKRLAEFLAPGREIQKHPDFGKKLKCETVNWEKISSELVVDQSVPEVKSLTPGTHSAEQVLKEFIVNNLGVYHTERNFPEKQGQSDLSPYLHFGQISARQVALAVKNSMANPETVTAFLEELIVRRELADNFCLYCKDYDRFEGFQPWAKLTLNRHRSDFRQFSYSPEQFETGETHDRLWNASQMEMVKTGKMHGYMRMYWAKKILEWSESPEMAMETAIYLNDKYELDGRDPSGYAGIAWAIGGTHDRPWGERNIFGMIRYMNEQGCRRKFDVGMYIRIVNGL